MGCRTSMECIQWACGLLLGYALHTLISASHAQHVSVAHTRRGYLLLMIHICSPSAILRAHACPGTAPHFLSHIMSSATRARDLGIAI